MQQPYRPVESVYEHWTNHQISLFLLLSASIFLLLVCPYFTQILVTKFDYHRLVVSVFLEFIKYLLQVHFYLKYLGS